MVHQHTPSPLNPLGVKGVGEGGAVAPPAAIANAISDALAPFGVEFNRTPITPEQIVKAVRAARPSPQPTPRTRGDGGTRGSPDQVRGGG
jgi:aerobic carbon-monoxide dehydrogenase large subunit